MISGRVSEKRLIEHELAERSPVVTGLPYYYQVHLNKLCNQKCIMCMPDGRHPRDEMPLEPLVNHVCLSLGLEPADKLRLLELDSVLERSRQAREWMARRGRRAPQPPPTTGERGERN